MNFAKKSISVRITASKCTLSLSLSLDNPISFLWSAYTEGEEKLGDDDFYEILMAKCARISDGAAAADVTRPFEVEFNGLKCH